MKFRNLEIKFEKKVKLMLIFLIFLILFFNLLSGIFKDLTDPGYAYELQKDGTYKHESGKILTEKEYNLKMKSHLEGQSEDIRKVYSDIGYGEKNFQNLREKSQILSTIFPETPEEIGKIIQIIIILILIFKIINYYKKNPEKIKRLKNDKKRN